MNPYTSVTQTVEKRFPIYVTNISEEIDCDYFADYVLQQQHNAMFNDNSKSIPSPSKYRLDSVIKKGWYSDYIERHGDKNFNPLIEIIESKFIHIDPTYSYFVDHYWYVVYSQNTAALPHSHGACDYSVVFYPKTTKYSTPICFKSVGSDIKIPNEKGTLIIFPGEAVHYVTECIHTETRIAISMNLYKKNRNSDT